MSTETIVMTGFPGFLGSRLLPGLLRRSPDARAVCLVQAKFADAARARAAELVAAAPELAGRIDLVEGDITAAGLGLDDPAALARRTTQLWHLAAVYDLSVSEELGRRVNVHGTRNVLRFARDAEQLDRHHYVSTCYVSGRYAGPFRETDLDVGQSFNNHYEATKFRAELDVAAARDAGMPTTVYRPSIVVGDSVTGATQKFDGPYFLMQWLLRQRRVALVPVIGDPTAVRFNMVPSDFVVDGIDALAAHPGSAGRTYALADPAPLTVDELIDEMCRATDRRGVRVRLPRRTTETLLGSVDALERFIGIPAAAVEYFVHPTHYDTTAAQRDLQGSGVACPPVPSYLRTLVSFLRQHAEADEGVMV